MVKVHVVGNVRLTISVLLTQTFWSLLFWFPSVGNYPLFCSLAVAVLESYSKKMDKIFTELAPFTGRVRNMLCYILCENGVVANTENTLTRALKWDWKIVCCELLVNCFIRQKDRSSSFFLGKVQKSYPFWKMGMIFASTACFRHFKAKNDPLS